MPNISSLISRRWVANFSKSGQISRRGLIPSIILVAAVQTYPFDRRHRFCHCDPRLRHIEIKRGGEKGCVGKIRVPRCFDKPNQTSADIEHDFLSKGLHRKPADRMRQGRIATRGVPLLVDPRNDGGRIALVSNNGIPSLNMRQTKVRGPKGCAPRQACASSRLHCSTDQDHV
jgi:hypothetical protein